MTNSETRRRYGTLVQGGCESAAPKLSGLDPLHAAIAGARSWGTGATVADGWASTGTRDEKEAKRTCAELGHVTARKGCTATRKKCSAGTR